MSSCLRTAQKALPYITPILRKNTFIIKLQKQAINFENYPLKY